jgi:hypothetical protein
MMPIFAPIWTDGGVTIWTDMGWPCKWVRFTRKGALVMESHTIFHVLELLKLLALHNAFEGEVSER